MTVDEVAELITELENERDQLAIEVERLKTVIMEQRGPYSRLRIQTGKAVLYALADTLQLLFPDHSLLPLQRVVEIVREQAALFPIGETK